MRPTIVLPFAALLLAACTAEPSAPAPGGDGGGGQGGGPGACVDHGDEGPCLAEDEASPCARGESCTLDRRSCTAGERCCTLPFTCAPFVGPMPGGARCGGDDECASGVCLDVGGGTCLRACNFRGADTCPDGFHCALVGLAGGATVRACLGGTAGAPEPARTVCRGDADCPADRLCRFEGVERWSNELPVGRCEPRVEGVPSDLGLRCDPPPGSGEDSSQAHLGTARCPERGLCLRQCDTKDAEVCLCASSEVDAGEGCDSSRCTIPCTRESDCPNRYTCSDVDHSIDDFSYLDWAFRVCQLPESESLEWGCWDELDCCKDGAQPGGSPCCEFSPSTLQCRQPATPIDRSHCAVRVSPTFPDRFVTVCLQPEGKGGPGEGCADDASCTSGLCVPDGAGGRVCTSPCEAGRDRCDAILPGSRCCPTPIAAAGGSCVDACRLDCEETPACEP